MKYFNFKLLIFFAALALASPPAWAGTVTDVIDRDATATLIGDTGGSSWINITVTGQSGTEYFIRTMGVSASNTNALNWNKNGYLYSKQSGGRLKSVKVSGDGSTNKSVDIHAANTAYTGFPSDAAIATVKATDNGTKYEFDENSNYTFIAINGKTSSTAIYSIEIEWETEGDTPSLPMIDLSTSSLTIKEDGGSFTVSGSNLIDNIGVTPSTGFTTDVTYIQNNEGSASGTVNVNYSGRELYAEGTVDMGTDKDETHEDITKTLNVTYRPDIYIYGDFADNRGWRIADDPVMAYSSGTYSKTITVTNPNTCIMFARKTVADNAYGWNNDRLFFGFGGSDWVFSADETKNLKLGNDNDYSQYYPVKFPNTGDYLVEINVNDGTATVTSLMPQGSKIYNKVTDASQLIADKKYILVYEKTPAFMGNVNGFGASITGLTIENSSVDISQNNNISELTLSGDASGWSFKIGDNYLSWESGNSLSLSDEISTSSKWTVSYCENKNKGTGFILTNAGTPDRVLQYNASSPRFACYTGTQMSAVLYVEDGVEPVLPAVVAPTILPEEREFASSVEVSMTCTTADAAIYYTLDGTDPTTGSTQYTDPFTLTATTTVKAIAVLGSETSEVVTATFTKTGIETIAAAKALGNNTNFTFVGSAVVTFHNGNHLFIRDDSGSGLIYGVSTNPETNNKFNNGDVLTPGWKARYKLYEDYTPEFDNASGVASTINNGPVAPEILNTLALTDVNKYAGFNNVTITRVDDLNYYFTVDEQEICLRRAYTDLVNELEVGKVYNVVGVVAVFEGTPQLNLTKVTIVKQAPELAFNPDNVTVYEGVQDFPEPALTAPEGVTVQSYASSNTDVVTVDNEGKVTIVGVGTAIITATTAENTYYLSGTATYNVEIKAKEAAGLSFGVTEPVTATYGDTEFNEPTLTYPAGLTVTYTCEPDSVATVDPATGAVTIVGAGTATVTATTEGDESHNGGSATYTINVAKAVATLTFAEERIEATYGGEVPANALTNEANLDVTYSSSDKTIATVDNEGKVTIVKAGEVTITATGAESDNYKGATATYNLTIAKAGATMSFSPNAVTIVEGQEFTAPTLTNAAGLTIVSYESSNTDVATVDGEGNVEIVGVGSATITATGAGNDNYNGTSATYTITVEPKPVVAAPTFTPAAGYYNRAQNVTIACETDGADIYYTTDGTDPTTESTKYTAAIPVDENMTIKAIAVKEGYTNSGIAVAEYVIDLPVQIAAPTFMPGTGNYTEAKEVAIACANPDASILYKIGDGEFQPYTKPFVVDQSCTITEKVTMGGKTVWTDNEARATYTISTLDPVKITDGYYQIKNNGNGKYANVQGRKTMTFTNDIDQQAGTVIRVQSKDDGEVQVLRSQAADLQGYANRAMRYVPEIVQKVVDKLHAEGSGEILGEDGLDAIMQKFDECFDYHLYVEGDLDNCRIYGKTPSMQPVVDFYNENQAKVDAKLPMLVDFINDAIQKVLVKTEGHGASILVPFSLDTIWNRMGGMLIRPVDDESTMAFYHQVLTNKQYVWDFAYQAATFYLEKVQAHPRYEEMKEYLGEFGQYIDKLEQVRPDTKYFIVQNNGKVDYISEGNADIIRNEPWTFWSVEPRSEFKVNFPAENIYGGNYVTTLYTDFAYDLPKSISAYKLTDINEQGYAKMEVLDGTIPAQTPVMLVAEDAGVQTLTLNIAPNALADTTGNQLHGPDYLINKYEIKTPQVQALFNLAKRILGDNFYNNNVAQYEHLMLKTAGTVNNRYFWGITGADLDSCIYIDEEGTERLEVRSLDSGEQGLGFYNNWTVSANKAFLANAEFNPIKLSLRRDINRDGKISIADVTALINILLVLPDKPYLDVYDYEAADVNENGSLQIHDVSALINYLLRRANH